jgi:hypothetical protein
MSDIATTKQQRDIMRHALGLDQRRESFRNHYCAAVGSPDDGEVRTLIEKGLMVKGETINDGREYYAHVTDAGKVEVTD